MYWISFLSDSYNSFIVVRNACSYTHWIVESFLIKASFATSLLKCLHSSLQVFALPCSNTLIEADLRYDSVNHFRTCVAKELGIFEIAVETPAFCCAEEVLCIVEHVTCLSEVVNVTTYCTHDVLSVLWLKLNGTCLLIFLRSSVLL